MRWGRREVRNVCHSSLQNNVKNWPRKPATHGRFIRISRNNMFPVFIPVFVKNNKEPKSPDHVTKHYFRNNGYDMIRWGDDIHALETFASPSEWSHLIIKQLKDKVINKK